MREFLLCFVALTQVLVTSSFDLSMDERIIKCIDWEDKRAPMVTVKLDQGDQNYHICLHTCWNLGYHYMAIKPGCSTTNCTCLENRPMVSRKCDQQIFDDCDNRKSIPVYYSVVSEEDHSVMACMPDSDVDAQLQLFKQSYVTSVSQCMEDCRQNKPTTGNIGRVLAGITSACDRIGRCKEDLNCKCVTTSPKVSIMSSECSETCNTGLTRCRRGRYTALYYTDDPLHKENSASPISLRSIIMISILSGVLLIFIIVFIVFVIRSQMQRKPLPFTHRGAQNYVDDQGTYRGNSSPNGLQDNFVHPPPMDSPRPTRSAPPPPPPPAFNKPYMNNNYQNPSVQTSSSPSSITPLITPTKSSPLSVAPKQTYDDAGYVSPTVIKSNKWTNSPKETSRTNSPKQTSSNERVNSYPSKGFQDSHLLDNDSRTSSFSSIKALFDTPKTGTPVHKPSPLAGGKSSPLTSKPHNSISAPFANQSQQRSPCYMNTNGFF